VSLILNIDTAVQSASVCLADKETVLGIKINPSQRDHAAWLHLAIGEIVAEHQLHLKDIDAFAITEGPGSYTGLRVGMSAVKGLCYSLKKPLITIGTLKMMAAAAMNQPAEILCPMIDARRMEVFTALYYRNLEEIMSPTNMILDKLSFREVLETQKICFFGNGSNKFQPLIDHKNALFGSIFPTAEHMVLLTYNKYLSGLVADLAYVEVFYGKDFHSTAKQSL
jgi:tRNA threonylcarbamoyladenosine biosynthesis protein TsaB